MGECVGISFVEADQLGVELCGCLLFGGSLGQFFNCIDYDLSIGPYCSSRGGGFVVLHDVVKSALCHMRGGAVVRIT